jgi:RNA polymerase sigma-70 factor (ECF subfamily)
MSQHDPAEPPRLRLVSSDRYSDWEAVYEDNATWVYRTIFARVGNQPDAEDLTAEVFLAALRPLRLTATVAEVRANLRTIARTVLAAHWRETFGREITSIEDMALPAPDSDETIRTAPQRVNDILESLPEHYRQILDLRFLQGHSIKKSAEAMGVSVANAKCCSTARCGWQPRSTTRTTNECPWVAALCGRSSRRTAAPPVPAQ